MVYSSAAHGGEAKAHVHQVCVPAMGTEQEALATAGIKLTEVRLF